MCDACVAVAILISDGSADAMRWSADAVNGRGQRNAALEFGMFSIVIKMVLARF